MDRDVPGRPVDEVVEAHVEALKPLVARGWRLTQVAREVVVAVVGDGDVLGTGVFMGDITFRGGVGALCHHRCRVGSVVDAEVGSIVGARVRSVVFNRGVGVEEHGVLGVIVRDIVRDCHDPKLRGRVLRLPFRKGGEV